MWKDLSMKEKAAYIKAAVSNGIYDLSSIKKEYNTFDEGGSLDDRDKILDRANYVASNYDDAEDFNMNSSIYAVRKFFKDNLDKGGLSNCTLSATQWIDPNKFYMSARNIVNNPNTGYEEISKDYAIPGDLLISKNPDKGTYHTMMIESFDGKQDPILRYSKGGHDTEDNLVTNKKLADYHAADTSQGGNHTEDHYFRYKYPNEISLHEAVVTAPRKHKYSGGGNIQDDDFESQVSQAISFGKFANSSTGKKVLPIVDHMRKNELEWQLHPEKKFSEMAVLGGALSAIPTPFTQGLGALLQVPDMLYDTKNLVSNKDISSASSVATDAAGFLPFLGTKAISITDDYLGTKGTNIYNWTLEQDSELKPWDYWRKGEPYTLPELSISPNKSRNTFDKGGKKWSGPSQEWRRRIASWEGSSMYKPASDTGKVNNPFEVEAKSFINVLPQGALDRLSPSALDALYSTSYNIGSGNFKRRVSPVLSKYLQGKATPQEVAASMYGTNDRKYKGLQTRRTYERNALITALQSNLMEDTSVGNTSTGNNMGITSTFKAPEIPQLVFGDASNINQETHQETPAETLEAPNNLETFNNISNILGLFNMTTPSEININI